MSFRRLQLPRLVCGLCLILSWCGLENAAGQPSPFDPFQHRALYLYNFAKFTAWPAGAFDRPDAPLVIGVLGESQLSGALEILRGKSIGQHPIAVKSFSNLAQVGPCHLLFVSPTGSKNSQETLAALARLKILTVGETDDFLEQGGMINLVMEKKTLTFDINQTVTEQAGLKIDTRLLRLARTVQR